MALLLPAAEAEIIRRPLAVVVQDQVAGVVLVHALRVYPVEMDAAFFEQRRRNPTRHGGLLGYAGWCRPCSGCAAGR